MASTILVVEDEPAIAELIAVNLSFAGHKVLRAADTDQANTLIRAELPDLVLLDWMLRRRAPQLTDDTVDIAGLRLDPSTHRVSGHGRALDIGPTEFRLLHFFMTHAERVHSRTQLLDHVWGDHVFVEERTVDVHIRRLRQALLPSGHDRLIETVRGAGYRFSSNPSETAIH